MEHEQTLMKKARALQKNLSNELLKLEKTQQQQAENDAQLKDLKNQDVEVKKEIDHSMDRIQKLQEEKKSLEEKKQDLKKEIDDQKQKEIDRLQPEIERYKKLIEDVKDQIVNNTNSIEAEEGKIKNLED